MTPIVEIELPLLLPRVKASRDQCVDRLKELVLARKGIQEAHLEEEDGEARLCLHFDPEQISLSQVERLAREAGAQVTERYGHEDVRITDMDCADCAASIEHVVGRLDGVIGLSVSYAAERMRVEYDGQRVSRQEILQRVRALGYQVEEEHEEGWLAHNRELLTSVASGVLLGAAWGTETSLGLSRTLVLPLYILSYLSGGLDVARHGLAAARRLRFDIDFLMVVAALGAAVLGNWPEGALLLFLFSLGHSLEHYAMGKARSAIRELGQLTPKTALVRRNGREVELPVEEIQRGDRVIVKPGQRIPVDGMIRTGHSAIDEAPITGESIPVEKGEGDEVFAGTINGESSLEIEVTKLAGETVLVRVVELVKEAEVARGPSQRFTERFTRLFVPAVLLTAGGLIAVPPLVLDSPFAVSFLRAMALLVAASPCALGLATPSAVLSGLAQAARNGVLIKGGAHLENLAGIRAIAFDKTGTLTRGEPQVTYLACRECVREDGHPPGVEAVKHCRTCRELLAVVAAAESRSAHPLARAIVAAARRIGVPVGQAEEVEALTGRGIRARLDGRTVVVGNEKLFERVPETLQSKATELEGQGRTTMLVQVDGKLLGLVALADEPRPEAAEAIRELKRLGIRKTILITGDNERTAAAIAGRLGIDEYRADLLPEEKVEAVKELLREYGQVAMVGDGVNDAPALANATVGIAMGGAGTDVALETADVALMADNLRGLPFLISLSRASRGTVRQNLGVSLGVIALLVPAAVLGMASIGEAILLHEGSTLAVVFNALRLLRFRR